MKMKQSHLMKSHLKGQKKKNQKQELYKPFDFFLNLKIKKKFLGSNLRS